MRNMLLDGLPSAVDVLGQSVPIATDYRVGILLERLLFNRHKTDIEKLEEALRMYYPGHVFRAEELEPAVDAMMDFYRCGRHPKKKDDQQAGTPGDDSEKSFDYDYDAGYIYASFVQAYGIDLATQKLHWWQFRALFESLPEDTKIMKVIGYRRAKVPDKASSDTRQEIERLKELYALPLDPDQEAAMTDLTEILCRGGNPYDLLSKGGQKDGTVRRDP